MLSMTGKDLPVLKSMLLYINKVRNGTGQCSLNWGFYTIMVFTGSVFAFITALTSPNH